MVQESDPNIDAQWARVRGKLEAEFGEATFKSWLKPLTLLAMDKGEIRIAVPTRFMRDWVRAHDADRIRRLWAAETRNVRRIEIVVQTAPVRSETPPPRLEAVRGGRPLSPVIGRGGVAQLQVAGPAVMTSNGE